MCQITKILMMCRCSNIAWDKKNYCYLKRSEVEKPGTEEQASTLVLKSPSKKINILNRKSMRIKVKFWSEI